MMIRYIVLVINLLIILFGLIVATYFGLKWIACDENCTHFLEKGAIFLGCVLISVVLYILRKTFLSIPGIDYK